MANTDCKNLLTKWFCVYLPWSKKANMSKSIARTGYAAAYPNIKHYHHHQLNFLFCIPTFDKLKKESKSYRTHPSIRGCASFARYDRYKEGDVDEDC